MGALGRGLCCCPSVTNTLCPPQERFQVKSPPHAYIQKLRSFLEPGVTRKVRGWGVWGSLWGFGESGEHSSALLCPQKFRRRVQESTKVLRELEISLRTNHIG